MASRNTRNQARNSQSTTPLTSTPLLRNRARKSIGTPPQSNKNVPTKKSKRTRSSSDSSNDSTMVNVQTAIAGPSQVHNSSDSEDAGMSAKGKRKTRRSQRLASDNEGSDTGNALPAKETGRSRKSLPPTKGVRPSSTTPVNTVGRGITDMTLNTSRSSNMSSGPPQGLMKLVNKCVFYILVADQKKHPIKKVDIVKNVFKDQNSKENYSAVMVKANEVLKKTFGLEILEIKNTKNNYILINILDSDYGVREYAEYSQEELQKRGLILLLLTIIFMNENSITEDKLWKALEPLGLTNSTIPHPLFGNVKKYITSDLVKEMYLEYTCISKDPQQYELTWGERAVQEIKKEDLLEFACEMFGENIKPEDWKLQFIDAKGRPSTSEA